VGVNRGREPCEHRDDEQQHLASGVHGLSLLALYVGDAEMIPVPEGEQHPLVTVGPRPVPPLRRWLTIPLKPLPILTVDPLDLGLLPQEPLLLGTSGRGGTHRRAWAVIE